MWQAKKWSPEDIHIKSWGTYECHHLTQKKGLCKGHQDKDHEMKTQFWVVYIVSKCPHLYPQKTEAEGDQTHSGKGSGRKTQMQPPEAVREKKHFSPSISGGVWPSQHLYCGGGHQNGEGINFCRFKSNQVCGTLFQQPSEINTAGNPQIHCTLYFSMHYAVLCPSLSQPEHIAFLQEIAQIHYVSAIHDGH